MPSLLERRPSPFHAVDRRLQRSRRPPPEVHPLLLERSREALSFSVRVCRDDADTDHRIRPLELLRRSELASVDIERLHQVIGREV